MTSPRLINKIKLLGLFAGAHLFGCGPIVQLDGGDTQNDESTTGTPSGPGSGTGSADTTPVTSPTPTSADTTSAVDSSTTDDEDSADFLEEPDAGPPDYQCDMWLQDCPRGQKCTPVDIDGDGGYWDGTRCQPLPADPVGPDEPCSIEGDRWSGVDDCALGSVCLVSDLDTLEGYCVPHCTGEASNPICTVPGTSCLGDESVSLCTYDCDPVLQDCNEGHACYTTLEATYCWFDASDGAAPPGTPCAASNQCNPGSTCTEGEQVPGCLGEPTCCTSYCSLDDPMPPCLPGQICEPFYEEGEFPGSMTLGICMLP